MVVALVVVVTLVVVGTKVGESADNAICFGCALLLFFRFYFAFLFFLGLKTYGFVFINLSV